jgi:ankyrin repeat protein
MSTLFNPDLTLDEAKERIQNGADVNFQNKYGETSLFYVKNVETAQLFIKHGIDINAKNKYGLSFIFYMDDIDILKFSIDHGLDINDINNIFGMTVLDDQNSLYNRSSKDNIDHAKLLIKYGAISGKIETYKKYRYLFTQEQQKAFDIYVSITSHDNDFFNMCLSYQNDQKNNVKIEIKDMDIV